MITHPKNRRGADPSRHYKHPACKPWSVVVLLALTMAWLPHFAAFGALINRKLSHPLVAGGDVDYYRISPDGRWAVYSADATTDDVWDLYSVPIEGGTPVQISIPLEVNSRIYDDYAISPDSRRVVYRVLQGFPGAYELFSAPIEGPSSASVRLNGHLVLRGNVQDNYVISRDSRRVVYVADQERNDVNELFSVPIDGPGTAGVQLSLPVPQSFSTQFIYQFALSPDSARVAYSASLETPGEYDLYSVPIDGPATASVRVSDPPSSRTVRPPVEFTPDSSRLLYIANSLSEQFDLFSVEAAGPASSAELLSGARPPGENVWNFEVAPDGSRVAYATGMGTNDRHHLFSVPLGGPAALAVPLTDTGPQDQNIYLAGITQDGQRAVYRQFIGWPGGTSNFSVPMTGPPDARVALNELLTTGGMVGLPVLDPDSRHVLFRADPDGDQVYELRRVPIDGPWWEAVTLNRSSLTSESVLTVNISPDGNRVAYLTDFTDPLTFERIRELYVVPAEGPGDASIRVNGALVPGGQAYSPNSFTPDSRRILYIADQDTDEVTELYVTELPGPAEVRWWNIYR